MLVLGTEKKENRITPKFAIPSVAVFMPALNEEEHIQKNLQAISNGLEKGEINRFVLVLDGCTDKTPDIVSDHFQLSGEDRHQPRRKKLTSITLENGAKITIFSKDVNQGKGLAFAQTMWTLDKSGFFKEENPVVVNVDSDSLNLEPDMLLQLASQLIIKEEKMLLGEQRELFDSQDPIDLTKSQSTHERYNGFRAISGEALKPLLNDDELWMNIFPTGICMEIALNLLIYGNKEPLERVGIFDPTQGIPKDKNIKLVTAPTGKNSKGGSQVNLAEDIVRSYNRYLKDFSFPLTPYRNLKKAIS